MKLIDSKTKSNITKYLKQKESNISKSNRKSKHKHHYEECLIQNKWNFKSNIKLKGVQILALGFIIVILVGAILLTLPISSVSGESTDFLDALFTSTSAVCVTGLVVVDTGSYWSMFGQTVIMILIEIGGLGFMSFTTLIAILLGKKITLRERLILQDAMNTFNIQGLVKMVRYVLVFTISVQFFGALLLSTQLVPQFGPG